MQAVKEVIQTGSRSLSYLLGGVVAVAAAAAFESSMSVEIDFQRTKILRIDVQHDLRKRDGLHWLSCIEFFASPYHQCVGASRQLDQITVNR